MTDEAWDDSPATHYVFAYDKKSQLLSADGYKTGSPNVYFSEYDYVYNNVGWVTSEVLTQGTMLKSTLATTYDLSGRRTVLKNSFSTNASFTVTTDDFQNEYGYDGKDRLTSLKQTSQSGGNVVANKYVVLGYNGQDHVIDIDRYANTTTSNLVAHTDYDRDFLGRMIGIDHFQGSTHFATYGIEYDTRSRITAIDSVFSNSAWDEDHDFTYDHTDQLTAADHSVQNDEAYNFTANGNRDGNQTHLGATTSSTVIANNRISSDGVYNYTYDDEGNMLTKVNISTGAKEEYSWDHRNRLAFVTFKNGSNVVIMTLAYTYDHNNLLLSRSLDADGAGIGDPDTTAFVHDGNQIVQIFYKATPGGTLALTDRLLWTDQVDYLVSDERVTSLGSAGTVYWSLPDHLGTVVDVATYNSGTDTTTIAKHRKFDAFGNITLDSATGVIFVMGFTGKYLDSVTGLQNNINRWYAAWLGEWMSEDPIKDGVNWRAYVGNHPTYATDPAGLEELPPAGNFKIGTQGLIITNLNAEIRVRVSTGSGIVEITADSAMNGLVGLVSKSPTDPKKIVDKLAEMIDDGAKIVGQVKKKLFGINGGIRINTVMFNFVDVDIIAKVEGTRYEVASDPACPKKYWKKGESYYDKDGILVVGVHENIGVAPSNKENIEAIGTAFSNAFANLFEKVKGGKVDAQQEVRKNLPSVKVAFQLGQ